MENKEAKRILRPAKVGAVLIVIAVLAASLVNFLTIHRAEAAQAAAEAAEAKPMVTVIPARPSTAPTPTPTVNSIRLYAYGMELTSDGFTSYVGDRAVKISAELDPELKHPPVIWRMSDSSSAALSVSEDRLSCEFTARKPSGKNELIVSCYGTETVIPVYLWER